MCAIVVVGLRGLAWASAWVDFAGPMSRIEEAQNDNFDVWV